MCLPQAAVTSANTSNISSALPNDHLMMDLADFAQSVQCGLKLAKRIYHGNNRRLSPPETSTIDRAPGSSSTYDPTAPMLYAVISDPSIVDNPDIPSYQPHVHGRCDPPALIPLQMNEVVMEIYGYLDRVFVCTRGVWRVHCVMGSRSCDCRLVVPMGEQGSVLGVEVNVSGTVYSTQLLRLEEVGDIERKAKLVDGRFLKQNIFSIVVPQVDGGSIISVKMSWSQQLLYDDGQFSITIPFKFPEYINPSGKKIALHEKIQLEVNTGVGREVLCKMTSHPMKEIRRQMSRLAFLYDAQILTWSSTDFKFLYEIPSNELFGCILLQSPSMNDFDQREMFSLYLFSGKAMMNKIFRKEVIFLIDISGSMRGQPLENAKTAISAACSLLGPEVSFSIIAFNGQTHKFSSSLLSATQETIKLAVQWLNENCVAEGGTNILDPLNEAVEMFSSACHSCRHIYLITDGAVKDERSICHCMSSYLSKSSTSPRIFTFGLGSYCNHYFLRMLATIGRGYYDAAFDADLIDVRLQRFFSRTSSPMLSNITIDIFQDQHAFEVYPSLIPDLLSELPVVILGRYQGFFPDTVKAKGILPDMSNVVIELRAQQTEDIPLDKIFAKQQIELLTAQSWLFESKELQEKTIKLSLQTGLVSEYTLMALVQNAVEKPKSSKEAKTLGAKKAPHYQDQRIIELIRGLTNGFGNVAATFENAPIGSEYKLFRKGSDMSRTVHSASHLCDCCCCFYCLKACSKLNDHCVLAMAQLCAAISCFGCLRCCSGLCCPAD